VEDGTAGGKSAGLKDPSVGKRGSSESIRVHLGDHK
jgi:hypothetical protein